MRNFAYERAASVTDVLSVLDASAGTNTYILAGGTTGTVGEWDAE